jgi:uncharacterized protein
MLSFDIRSLAREAATVDAVIRADDAVWLDEDFRPAGEGVRVTGRLSHAGTGRYYFSGHLSGVTQQDCRRCLTPTEASVDAEVHAIFAEPGGHEDEDDPDVYPVGGDRSDEIDLRPALREQWLLEVPAFLVCRPDCKGLCPKCGADLNAGACGCAPETDERWAALRKLRDATE